MEIRRLRDFNIVKRYNNAEYAFVADGLVERILAAGAEKLHVPAEYFTLYQAKCAVMDNIVAVSRIADETEKIVELEKEVDKMVRAILGGFRVARSTPISSKRAAGTTLCNAASVYKRILRLPQRQKLQNIKGMLLDLQREDLTAHIETLGMSAEIEELTLQHARLSVLLSTRAQTQMQNSVVKSKALRQEMDTLYEIITTAIWVHSITDPSEEATSFIDSFNKLLLDAETAYHQRKAHVSKTDDEQEEGNPSEEEMPSEEQVEE